MFTNNREFLIGADPEVFLKKKGYTKNFFHCAEGVIPGTKEKPYVVPAGAIQVDGMACEFNINPAKDEEEFFTNISLVLRNLANRVRKKGFDIYATPIAYFTEEEYNEASDAAKELGCNPDYNAYTGKVNPTPKPPDGLFRTGAGHVHIGWGSGFNKDDPMLMEACCHIIKHLDTCVGKPLSLVSNDYERRKLYGDFGAFRPTHFGVEYRTPSNTWLESPEHIKWVAKQVFTAVENAYTRTRYDYKVDRCPSFS